MITDRLRFTIFEMNTNRILSRDLVVQEPEVMWRMSSPAVVAFKLMPGESLASSYGINWKTWGQWIVTEMEINYVRRIIACTIVTNVKSDPESTTLQIESKGFLEYANKIPFLENFSPIAVDPFEIVQRVWEHLQSFSNANLEVEVRPASSGTQMLPGYSFDGTTLNFDFFAVFYRAVDFEDCGDIITGLSRDIPFDMFETAEWNDDRTEVTKTLQLAYPYGGLDQIHLKFLWGDNIISAEKAEEMDIEPVSDVIVRSWLPGRVMVAQLSNYDPVRARRVMMEDDAKIDSQERAAAWAKRRLQKRNVPFYFSKITIDANHPHAPAGSFDVGDSIYVQAPNYPWYGNISQQHRIESIAYKEAEGTMDLGLKVEGAFNYDPIEYNPDFAEQPHQDLNRLSNGYFANNMSGWSSLQGQWFRVPTETYQTYMVNAGSVRVDHDDHGEALRSNRAVCTPGEHLHLQCAVKWEEVTSGSTDAMQLMAFTSHNATQMGSFIVDQYIHPEGAHGWEMLEMLDWEVPDGINEVALQFTVTSGVNGGKSWWTYARVLPTGAE